MQAQTVVFTGNEGVYGQWGDLGDEEMTQLRRGLQNVLGGDPDTGGQITLDQANGAFVVFPIREVRRVEVRTRQGEFLSAER